MNRQGKIVWIVAAWVMFGCGAPDDTTDVVPPTVPAADSTAMAGLGQLPAASSVELRAPLPVAVGSLVRVQGRPHLVLHGEPPAEAYGPLLSVEYDEHSGEWVVMRKLLPTESVPVLPSGHRLRLMADVRALCFAQVETVHIVGRVTGDMLDADLDGLDEKSRVEQMWSYTEGGRMVLARLAVDDPACEEAEWARSAELGETPLEATAEAAPSLIYGGLQALQQTDAYRAAQKLYREYYPERRGHAWYHHEAASIRARVVQAASVGGPAYLWMAVDMGEGCGGFTAHVVALWRLQPGGRMDLLFDGDLDASVPEPTVAVWQVPEADINLLAPETWLGPGPGGYTYRRSQVAYYGCPC